MGRTTLFALVEAVAAALACGTARADGLPVVGVDGGGNGVLDANAGIRYLALGLQNEEPGSYDFSIQRSVADYQPGALRGKGTR